MEIKIKNKSVGKGFPCFIIAEAGVNHNGKFDLAEKLIDAAKEAGADAVKFQIFKAENLVTLEADQAEYQTKNIGKKESQYQMLKRLELSYSDFERLKEYCDKKGIIFLATPHSGKEDVDFISKICPAIKVSSPDVTNLPILEYVARKNLPIILSTGASTSEEVREAVKTILFINKELILLHCTTNYPTKINEVNLRAMKTMEKEFGLPIGYSDHTEGIKISLVAVVLGACIIEKHFTLDKNMLGPDHKASLEPQELKKMVDEIRKIEKRLSAGENPDIILGELNVKEALGNGIKKPNLNELEVAKAVRKSIVATRDIEKGTEIREDMLAIKRPGTGIKPKFINKVIGKKTKKDIKKDELIKFEDLI